MVDGLTNEGEQYATTRISDVVPKYEMKFSAASGLHEFSERYKFFSPAPLYIYGRFDDGPIMQFMVEEEPDLHIMFHRFACPIFSGLTTPDGDVNWNFVLWGMDAETWPAFENYLLSFVITDTEHQCVFNIGAQDITIADPLTVDKQVILQPMFPSIDIVVFGVDSNKYAVAMEPCDDLMTPPKVKFHPPQPGTAAFANALFSGVAPAAARERLLQTRKGQQP